MPTPDQDNTIIEDDMVGAGSGHHLCQRMERVQTEVKCSKLTMHGTCVDRGEAEHTNL